MNIIILAGNTAEATAHAKRHKLPKGRFRYAVKASSIRGLRVAEIHELPGFRNRVDRHSINAVLKHAKIQRTLFHEPRTYVAFDRAWDLAHEAAEILANAGRLGYGEALDVAYIIKPVEHTPVLQEATDDVVVKRVRKPPTPRGELF